MGKKRERGRHRGIKIVLSAAGILLLALACYAAYLLLDYRRLEDHLDLEIRRPSGTGTPEGGGEGLHPGEEYTILTYNVGFGAYTPDFSFFMDGGKSAWAESRESVLATVSGAASLSLEQEPDIVLFQEVDRDSTRSYHVDQYALLDRFFPEYESAFAQNYDSSFLFWPPWQPHGKSKAGVVTYSRFPIASAERRSLPVSQSPSKFFDLDRCYSVSRIPVEEGRYLSVYNLHLSAYGNSDEIRRGQVNMLFQDMERDRAAGGYVICGGDFNHDLKADEEREGEYESWAYPFPRSALPEGFAFAMDGLREEEKAGLHDSARNADTPYEKGRTYTVTLDGFIISDNVECIDYENVDTGYRYSDHDPVTMRFRLKLSHDE